MAEPVAGPGELSEIEAAGAIVWRRGPDGPEVLLIHRPRRDDWSLAKGKRDPGEQLPQTAVREVVEETGLHPRLGRRLQSVRYLAGTCTTGRPRIRRRGAFRPRRSSRTRRSTGWNGSRSSVPTTGFPTRTT
jgi:8-oxo-dGTP pyrophosphatase MutT (NUDIX family)